MKKKKEGNWDSPQIVGYPEHHKNFSLAYFQYFATGEGFTCEAEILHKDQKPTIGFEGMPPDIIPFCVEAEVLGYKYLTENVEFKARFLECFGVDMWSHFRNCCLGNKNPIGLIVKMHYNLS